jgi:hypothetical protein
MTAACHYTLVRFMPFVETGEFANVGVVLMSPSARFFGFKLVQDTNVRVTNFFQRLDGKVFGSVLRLAQEELRRVEDEFKRMSSNQPPQAFKKESALALWSELTKPLATILRTSEPRLVMASDPRMKLDELFALYVERDAIPEPLKV